MEVHCVPHLTGPHLVKFVQLLTDFTVRSKASLGAIVFGVKDEEISSL